MNLHEPLVATVVGTVLTVASAQSQAQDRPLTADFPEVYRVGGTPQA